MNSFENKALPKSFDQYFTIEQPSHNHNTRYASIITFLKRAKLGGFKIFSKFLGRGGPKAGGIKNN